MKRIKGIKKFEEEVKYYGRRVKKLESIKNYLHEYNEYWWKKERTDLDLKYYVPTDTFCKTFADYEIGVPIFIQAYIDKLNRENPYRYYDIDTYMERLAEKGKIEYKGSENTYNLTSKTQNDFVWHTYKVKDYYIVLVSFHIGGDIRGNYTDYFVLKFDYDNQFENICLGDLSRENNLTFDLEIDNKVYAITPFALEECLEVYDYETDDYIYGIYETTDEEVIANIKEKVKEREEENNEI